MSAKSVEGWNVSAPGVVYTRGWVVDLILNLVGYTPDADLTAGCIIEPSCGDGAFLVKIVDRLCASAISRGKFESDVLAKCIRAFDIDPIAVSKSRAVVRDSLIANGLFPEAAENMAELWVREADFLLSDSFRARWVVGNPPYIRASKIDRSNRACYKDALSTMTMGTDLYVGFFEKGLRLLEEEGALCYICSDRWLQNRYGAKLRCFMADDFELVSHVRLHDVDAFVDEVAAYPAISLIRRGAGRCIRYADGLDSAQIKSEALLSWLRGGECQCNLGACSEVPSIKGSDPVALTSADTLEMLSEISRRYPSIEDAGVSLGIGVASGCDEVYITEDPNVVEEDRLLPLFYMKDWRSGKKNINKWLVNPWGSDGSLVSLADYPRMGHYFRNNEDKLKKRRVARDNPDAWYRTLDKPKFELFGQEMLLFPDMAAKADPVYSDGSKYPHHNCYWVISTEWDVKALGGLLMSDIVASYVDAYGVKMRGKTLRFQAQYLRLVHIPRFDQLTEKNKKSLSDAFSSGDREAANRASLAAYGLEDFHA